MGPYAIGAGIILIALGGWGYLGADKDAPSMTSLIPAFFGAPLVILGVLALKEHLRKHAMHAAAAIGLIGFIAAAVGLAMGYKRTGTLESRGAIGSGGMALVCLVFVGLCVNSFIQARRARRLKEQSTGSP
jgi:uncharacterized membrane protein HdeD (DUF308 family)